MMVKLVDGSRLEGAPDISQVLASTARPAGSDPPSVTSQPVMVADVPAASSDGITLIAMPRIPAVPVDPA